MDAENLEASIVVTNTGNVDGEEVVQLYGKDLLASIIRPRQELVGFKRIALKAGESKKVRFQFRKDQLAFQNVDFEWIIEKGKFQFFVGGSSDDVRSTVEYIQKETEHIDPRTRGFYADCIVEAI